MIFYLRTMTFLREGTMNYRQFFIAILVTAFAMTGAQPVWSQFGGKSEPQEIKIFNLQNIRANEAINVLSMAFKDTPVRFAVDERANSIIAVGAKETLSLVEPVLMRLDDKETIKASERKVVILQLKNAPASVILDALQNAEFDGVSVRAVEHQNSLLVVGTDESIERIKRLVKELDVSGVTPEMEDAQLRVVWLVDRSLAKDDAQQVPADLLRPIEKLAQKLGLGELRTAAQFVVNVGHMDRDRFSATGTAMLYEEYNLNFAGAINVRSQLLEVEIAARAGKADPICTLNTTVKATPGHPVILGMSTVASKASIFVVEILAGDNAEN
jgi:hypothetical protein